MAAPPAQYAQWSAPSPQADGAHDEVRTIFVLGFPPDVKERELQNLLRWWPGYEASQMNFKGDQPMGFALFSTAAMAMAARDALQNLVFDADTNSVLRAEMAKKNLYVKRGVAGEIITGFDASKRMRTGGNDYSPAPYPAPYGAPYPNQVVPAAAPSWGPQGYVAPAPQYEQYAGYAVSQPPPIAPAGYAPVQNTKDNPPCNTLFIGNLGEAVNETELRGLFSSQPGFRQMKVLRQGKNTVCFIEFVDVNTAMTVHSNLQGAVLSTSDRGGMRIQYPIFMSFGLFFLNVLLFLETNKHHSLLRDSIVCLLEEPLLPVFFRVCELKSYGSGTLVIDVYKCQHDRMAMAYLRHVIIKFLLCQYSDHDTGRTT